MGLGLYHSGVEVFGSEWTYAGGSGVFSHLPRQPPGLSERPDGVRFHTTLELGSTTLSRSEVDQVIVRIADKFFGGDEYHLLTQNCNTFSNALSIELLGRPIPGRVNRMANMGVCFGNCVTGVVGAPPIAPGNDATRRGEFGGGGGGRVVGYGGGYGGDAFSGSGSGSGTMVTLLLYLTYKGILMLLIVNKYNITLR